MNNINKRPKISRWKLEGRISSYFHRNKKLSPLHQLEYNFMNGLYKYLSGQQMNKEFKYNLYQNYTLLIDKSFWFNRDTPSPTMLETIYTGCQILLDFQSTGPYSFILLNNDWHYKKMKYSIDMMYTWSLSPTYYGYASETEFWDLLNYLRTQFNSHKISMEYHTGKYPRAFRRRFKRI